MFFPHNPHVFVVFMDHWLHSLRGFSLSVLSTTLAQVLCKSFATDSLFSLSFFFYQELHIFNTDSITWNVFKPEENLVWTFFNNWYSIFVVESHSGGPWIPHKWMVTFSRSMKKMKYVLLTYRNYTGIK